MIDGLKPYPDYQESGSRWLGNVPSHWEVRNLRTLIRQRNERNRPDLPLLSVAREKGVFVRSLTDATENHNVIPDDLSNYKVACAGSLVINKMKAWQGSMGIAPVDGIVSPAYFVYDFAISNRAFGQALLRSKPYVAHFAQASDGVRVGQWDLTIAGMRAIPVLIPPPDEQAAIVRFLNWANGRLERAVRAKRKVIALLDEQKQAIIHRAVFRGLDSSVPLKPSAVPWLCEIPQHWNLVPNRSYLTLQKRLVGQRSRDFTLLSLTLRGIIARDMENPNGKWPASFDSYQEVAKGDLVFCLFDIDETPRFVGLSRLSGMITGAYTVFACKDSEIAEWVYQFYLAMDFGKRLKPAYTGLRKVIPKTTFLACKIPLPPVEERRAILQTIHARTASIVVAASRLEREIELIREYQTRLTSDVVTGKLAVLEAAARLPDEILPHVFDMHADPLDEIETADEEVSA